jgi:hypothetical protein
MEKEGVDTNTSIDENTDDGGKVSENAEFKELIEDLQQASFDEAFGKDDEKKEEDEKKDKGESKGKEADDDEENEENEEDDDDKQKSEDDLLDDDFFADDDEENEENEEDDRYTKLSTEITELKEALKKQNDTTKVSPLDSVRDDLDQLAESLDWDAKEKKTFGKMFTKMFKAHEDNMSVRIEQAAEKKTKEIIAAQVKQKSIKDVFFSAHPKLKKHHAVVSTVANEISAKYPKKSTKQVLNMAARAAYNQLKITTSKEAEKGSDGKQNKKTNPAFAKGQKARKGKRIEKLSATQKEIGALMDY